MNTKALFSVAVLGLATALFSACGDGDSTKVKICNQTEVTCLNDRGGEVCSGDGTVRLPFSCADDQKCCSKSDKNCKGPDGMTPVKTSCVGVNTCDPGETQCGSDGVSLVCAADGKSWATVPCVLGTVCEDGACVGACEPGETQCGSDAISQVCATDGKGWASVPCAPGTGCDSDKSNKDTYGTCVRGATTTVVICGADDATCADGNTVKSCEEDGSNWVYVACAANEVCNDGACELDKAKGCVPHSGTCEDLTHLRVCADDGQSYEKTIKCPSGTTCADGGCQGPVCTVGQLRCDDVRAGSSFLSSLETNGYQPQTLYQCNASGTGWDTSACAPSEICVYDNISVATVNTYLEALRSYYNGASTGGVFPPSLQVPSSSMASCQTPECAAPFALRDIFGTQYNAVTLTAGSFVCGDPTDPTADPLASFSLCEGLPPFNNLHWANYACTAPEQCTYQGGVQNSEEGSYIAGPVCAAACTPNTTACFSERNGAVGEVSSTGESTVTCGDDGQYDFSTRAKCLSSDKNPRELWCGPNLKGTADNYNIGTCMEPACAAWFAAFDTFSLPQGVGACAADGRFYPCLADGTFGDPTSCAECNIETSLPQYNGFVATFAGYDPGTCTACKDGAQQCVFAGGPTPYYQECENGLWTTKSCAGGEACTDFQDPNTALGAVACGVECAPYTAYCVGKQIQTCDKNGVMGDPVDCKTGACSNDDQSNTGGGNAFCEAECLAGSFHCTTLTDVDNADFNAPAAVACSSKGRFDEEGATMCNYLDAQNPETCIEKLGCVACDPGTFSGRPEVRCALDTDGQAVPALQICKPDGTWAKAIDCPGVNPDCVDSICVDLGGTGGQGPI